MNYTSITQDIMFRNFWETHPYSSGVGGAGDTYYFDKPGFWNTHEGEIPKTFVKLNVRDRLNEFYPGQFPNMCSIGYAVKNILEQCEVKKYISAEDRGWESSDFWATLEAVFIPSEEYEKGIIPKINAHALIFKGTNKVIWENYPYNGNAPKEEIPKNFVKLNITDRVKEFFPDQSPDMGTLCKAVKQTVEQSGVTKCITAEDEAVFIPIEDYQKGILPKIYTTAEIALNNDKKRKL